MEKTSAQAQKEENPGMGGATEPGGLPRRPPGIRQWIWAGLLVLGLFPLGFPGEVFSGNTSHTVPQRMVSLAPSVTEVLFALGAGDRVVGVTRYCDWPPEARERPQIGGVLDVDRERLVALQPDLVLAVEGLHAPEVLEGIRRLGIPLRVLHYRNLEDVFQGILRVGEWIGERARARELVAQLRQELARIRSRVAGLSHPRVLYLVSVDPLISVGPGSFIQDLIHLAGGENLLADAPVAYPRVGVETVLMRDPEVILISTESGSGPEDLPRVLRKTTAVATGRVYVIEADWVHRPGPRILLGIQEMVRRFHGPVEP